MKKFSLIILTVFLNCALFSCTPNSIAEEEVQFEQQATEGDDGEMTPEEEEEAPTKD
ncbi:hypothetical protein C8N46_101556 [Kordia periserrulae]|uniref:Uncharacterized protein n=1 Tax=Kordia periserrulae TaxID=701523 RepID=A0A2T6C6P9_9FLAO|nr:hypothetical protein [Kordia periserrulae]PTX63946.1 hypothetical protein C8N46_101556 [Kordia periserrulae]